MKSQRKSIPFLQKTSLALAVSALLSTLQLHAQLTWDPGLNTGVTGGAGTWNTSSSIWWNGTSDVVWVNTGTTPAIFGGTGGTVTLATGANLNVGNLTLNSGVGTYTLQCATTGQGLTVKPGGATWTLNNANLTVSQNGTLDTTLTMSSGDTLTVTGSGTFNAGVNPAAAGTWLVGGSSLSVGGTLTLAGNANSVGASSNVIMAAGTTYYHQRNIAQTYTNRWNLSGGRATFSSNNGGGGRSVTLSGVISGSGGMDFLPVGTGSTNYFVLNNAANSFAGGIRVQDGGRVSVFSGVGDGALGAVPVAPVPNYIDLTNGGVLWLQGVTINANRGITLENGGGVIVNNNTPNSFAGQITGPGGLQIGLANTTDGNTLILSGANNYAGNTAIVQGSITLGVNNTLPTNTVVSIGGAGTSQLRLNGFSQTIGGLSNPGSNTRQVVNTTSTGSPSLTPGTLIFNVASNGFYSYTSAFGVSPATDQGNFSVVKNGPGLQSLGAVAIGGTVTVNNGVLQLGDGSGSQQFGGATVNGGTLIINENATTPSVVVESTGTLSLQIGTALTSLTVGTLSIGPAGNPSLNVNYGILASGNPSTAALTVTSPDGFTPGATNISVNLAGTGLAVGQFPLITYTGTALTSITNFTLASLPDGVSAVLSNNVANSSVDVVVTAAPRLLTWYGDGGTGVFNSSDWDVTSPNWSYEGFYNQYYTNSNPPFGFGDAVLFGDAFDGTSTNVVLSTALTPQSVTLNNSAAVGYLFSGAGKLSGSMSLSKAGNGLLVLANTGGNDYTGGTFLQQGTMTLGVDNALPTNGIVNFPTGGATAYLYLNGFNQTLGGLIGSYTGSGFRHLRNGSPNPVTLTLNVTGTNNCVFQNTLGDQTFTNSDINNFNVVKTGTGSQVIRNCSYLGTTTINGGTLSIIGTLPYATNTVMVNATGTLGGNGTLGGAVIVNPNGTLAPGYDGIGSMTVSNNVTLGGNTLMKITKDGGITNDQVMVSGTATYGGTLTVTNVGATVLTDGDVFKLFSAANHISTFASISPATPGVGLAWNFNPTNGVLSVVSSIANYSTNLSFTVSGGSINLAWPATHLGWILQTETNALSVGLTTNWVDVAGSDLVTATNIPVSPANPVAFFRLRHP